MEDSLEVRLVICPNANSDSMTVLELVQRDLLLKKSVKPNTLTNYRFVVNALKKEPFSQKAIGKVKMSDAKLWLVKFTVRRKELQFHPQHPGCGAARFPNGRG